jgi:hypothetical protein
VENVGLFAFAIVWVGVCFALLWRYRAQQRAYLHQFPPVEGVPLEMYLGFGPPSVRHGVFRALNQRQADPELERLCQEMWRRYRHFLMWWLGFPLLVVGVVVILILTGIVH